MFETEYYQNRFTRDLRAADLKSRGFTVRKSSCRNVVLDPAAVEDYRGTPSPNGFGGYAAQWFGTLYKVEVQ